MKKLMFAAAIMAAGAAMAVESGVVGYNTLNLNEPMMMLGISFSDCAGNSNGIRLGDLSGDFSKNDLLMIATSEYDEMEDDTVLDFSAYTYKTSGASGAGWYKGGTFAADVRFKPGTAMYFQVADAESPIGVTGSGAVTTEPITQTFTEPMTMISSAFPAGFKPNDKTLTEWTGLVRNDLIQVASSEYDEMEDDTILDFQAYTYKTSGAAGAGWYQGGTFLSSAVTIPGQGFYLTLDPQEGERDYAEVSLKEYSPLAPKALD